MAATPEQLAKLRRELAARFPPATRPSGRALPTEIPAIDAATGGLPLGAITEFVCAAPSCGGQLLLGQLLAVTRATRTRVALVDAGNSFDPSSFPADQLVHVVWTRCTNGNALAAADLLTRDANFGLIILDLRREVAAELHRTTATAWYRLQRALEATELALVVFTPCVSVPSAKIRFVFTRSHSAATFDLERSPLGLALAPVLQRQRGFTQTAVA